LKEKHRDGAKVIKRYIARRRLSALLPIPRTPEETAASSQRYPGRSTPLLLLRDIRLAQERLVAIADTPGGQVVANDGALPS